MSAGDEEAAILLRGVRATMGAVAGSLARAFEELTPPQLRVLVLLRSTGEMQVGQVGTTLGLSPSGATRFVARLDRDGWLHRRRATDDRRSVTVALTRKGERFVDGLLVERGREMRRALDRVPEEDRATVLQGLRIFADAVDEPADSSTLESLGFAAEDEGA
ncbi:MarR family winged helix-turn-helix transcriptional regulator [Amnibacterium endophyticum]|uniref:MarR family winged helix-turn-helix transcriptional regulator n=1 Tax=Amnibacterium endophyticum TaxID=2109337 RepID=A0ABW4LGZ3_9MICO